MGGRAPANCRVSVFGAPSLRQRRGAGRGTVARGVPSVTSAAVVHASDHRPLHHPGRRSTWSASSCSRSPAPWSRSARSLDVFGVLVLAGTTGLGGGFLRDVLIDATPPAALEDWRYLLVPVAAGLLTFGYHPALGRMERTVTVLDAFGLGLFCVTGALKALDYGLGPVPAALMGMVTGIGGGMLRDVLAGRVPAVFRGELYATPALAGAVVVVVGARTRPARSLVVAFAGAGLCIGLAAARDLAPLAGAGADRPGQRVAVGQRWRSVAEDRGAGRGWRRPGPGRAGRAARGTRSKRGYAGARSAARAGVHLAPVRAAVVGAHDRLEQREVREVVGVAVGVEREVERVAAASRSTAGCRRPGSTRISTGKVIFRSEASSARGPRGARRGRPRAARRTPSRGRRRRAAR